MIRSRRDVPALIRAVGVSKTYGRTQVLSDVSFDVQPGEVHALLGGNGSGKSTLIKALAGVVSFDSGGSIETGATSTHATRWSPQLARAAHLRFVHQDLGLFPQLSVVDNLALGSGFVRTNYGRIRWAACHQRAQALLRRYGIDAEPSAKVDQLTLAQQAMLAIARALQDVGDGESAVVVLDEPTGALPADEAQTLHESLRRLTAFGHAVVLVTHDIDEALSRCDRVTVLRDGVRIHAGSTAELDRDGLIHLIVGRSALDGDRARRGAVAGETPVLQVSEIIGRQLDIRGLQILPGEIVGLTGLLGAGAEEVLQSIFGLTTDVRCSMWINGKPYTPRNPRTAMSQGVAYLPSDRLRDGAFRGLSVLENLTAASMSNAAPHGKIRHRTERLEAKSLVDTFRVRPNDPSRPIESLSGGNQQKVLLARLARRCPRVLLLEDPTRGVDVGARADIWSLLTERVRSEGLAILVTSSDPEELATNCDRVVVLGSGRIHSEIAGADLQATRITGAAYAAGAQKELHS